MRKAFAVVVFLALMCGGAWADVAINETNFPDKSFRSIISSNFDTDSDGVLSDAEIATVTTIMVNGRYSLATITSLKGVEHFTALNNLICTNAWLETLDISKNTALTELSCVSSKLESLDVSKNTALTDLSCNDNRLTVLDVSKNTALTTLYCYNNHLTNLDLSNNTVLTSLTCNDNNLLSLDLSHNTALQYLFCSDNRLMSLDLSKNIAIEELYCNKNQLTTLDVSKNTALTTLYCSSNQLTTLDLSNNTALTSLFCGFQAVSPLIITSSGNASYPYQLNFGEYMSSDKFVNVSDVQGFDYEDTKISTTYENGIAQFATFPEKVTYNYSTGYGTEKMDVTISGILNKAEINEITFPDEVFREYVSENFDKDNNGILSSSEIGSALRISISGTSSQRSNLSSLKGVENFIYLNTLDCSYSRLTSLDVSGCAKLNELNCSNNQLTTLDVSKNTALTKLNCTDNWLTSLNVGRNTVLKELYCGNSNIPLPPYCNQLTVLDVSGCTALEKLNCSGNQLTTLDVSACTELYELYCSNEHLTTLNLSGCTKLHDLYCSSGQLTALDVSKCTDLFDLQCSNNRLTTLDLSNNTNLYRYIFYGSQAVSPLSISDTGDTSYPYQLNFSEYMSSDKFVNVSDVQGLASNGTNISTTYANGIAQFASRPTNVKYNYTTGHRYDTGKMDVIISDNSYTPPHYYAPTISGTFPEGKVSTAYSASISVSDGQSPYTWSYNGTLPDGTRLTQNSNGDTYTLSGNPTKAGTFAFTVTVTDADSKTTSKALTVTISSNTPTPPPGIAPTISGTFPEGKVSTAYSASIKVANGKSPYTWSYSGTLPDGTRLTQNSNGDTYTLSGNPTKAGTFTFTVTVTDADSRTASKAFTVTISAATSSPSPTPTPTPTPTPESVPTPDTPSAEVLSNIADKLGAETSGVSYIGQSDMTESQTPTAEIENAVNADGYEIISNQGSISVEQSGSYAFPITVPEDLVGTNTALKVYLADRTLATGTTVNASAMSSEIVEAQIFTESGETVTTLPEKVIAAVNLEVSTATTFSTHVAKKAESSNQIIGTTGSGGCNSGLAVLGLGLAVLLMFRRSR